MTIVVRQKPVADAKMEAFVGRIMEDEQGEMIRDKRTGRIYEVLLIAKFIDPHVDVVVCKDYLDLWVIPLSEIEDKTLFQRNL